MRPFDRFEAERKTTLRCVGITQRELGQRWGRSQPWVSQWLSGRIRSVEHEREFARLVGRPYAELWPGRAS